ncbi:MAG: hypothetical protein ACLP00_12175 [Terracidiphilus sp.]
MNTLVTAEVSPEWDAVSVYVLLIPPAVILQPVNVATPAEADSALAVQLKVAPESPYRW